MLIRNDIYHAIRHAILSCEFEPGQQLREQVLAERFGVSRSPIRDSLLRLEQEKLVTVLPRQGYRVNPILISDVQEIFGLLLLVEPACAAGAARRDDATVQTLEAFRGCTSDDANYQAFTNYNRAFHGAVADMSGSARLATIANDVRKQIDRLVSYTRYDDLLMYWIDQVLHEHDALIDAIQSHDSALASRLARQHAEGARSRIMNAVEKGAACREP